MSEYIGWLTSNRSIVLDESQPIVRCGNCRYYDFDGEPSEVYPDRHWCDKLTVYMPPLGFCSFGKGE